MNRGPLLLRMLALFCLMLALGAPLPALARDDDRNGGRDAEGRGKRPAAERIERARQAPDVERERFGERRERRQERALERQSERQSERQPTRESFRARGENPEADESRGERSRPRRLRDDWDGAVSGRPERLSPEERRELRREIHDAGRDLYAPPPRKPKRDR